MASSVLAGLLETYLGQYLELSHSSISVGAEVCLYNVSLKESALSDLGLPVKIHYGRVSKLVIKIPWFSLFTSSTSIVLDGLHLLVVPTSSVLYDPEKEVKEALEAKRKRLQRAEDAKIFKKTDLSQQTNSGSKDTFIERLGANILKNLEVTITQVHIRYEDAQSTRGGQPFAAGITLSRLLINTKSENDDSKSLKLKLFQKEVVLDSLALYWKPRANLYSSESLDNEIQIQNLFNDNIGTKSKPNKHLKYLLGPICSTARLEWCLSPEIFSFSKPQVDMSIEMEELGLSLSKYQYQDFALLLQSFDYMRRASQFRKYKARYNLEKLANYQGRAKDLWKFAMDSIFEEEVMRKINNWSWKHIKSHTELCRQYRLAYKQKIELGEAKISPQLSADLNLFESKLSLINIRIQRQLAEREVSQKVKENEAKNSTGWFSSWFGKQEESTTAVKEKLKGALTLEEKEKLFDVLDYQENDYHGIFPKSFVAKKLNFNLNTLKLTINDEDINDLAVLTLVLNSVQASISQRPSCDNVKANMTLSRLTIVGVEEAQLVTTKALGTQTLLNFKFENNPPASEDNLEEFSVFDQRIVISSSPLEFIYDSATFNHLKGVFRTPDEISLSNIQQTAASYLKEYRESSVLTLQYVIENQNLIDVDVCFHSSQIVLPLNGQYIPGCPVIVANLGRIVINTEPVSDQMKGKLNEIISLRDQAYYKFDVSLEHMQLLVALQGEEWRKEINKEQSPLFMLNPTSLKVKLESCLIRNDPELPLLKIKGGLDLLSIHVTDERLIKLLKITDTLIDSNESDIYNSLVHSDSVESMTSALSSLGNVGSFSQGFAVDSMDSSLPVLPNKTVLKGDDSVDNSLVNVTDLTLDFVVKTVDLKISERKADVAQDLFFFEMTNLGVSSVFRRYDFEGCFTVGTISCEHMKLLTPQGTRVKLIKTLEDSGEGKLLSLKYKDFNKNSPQFDSVLKNLKIEFASVRINLHQNAFLDLMSKIDDLTNEMSNAAKNLLAQPPTIDEDEELVMPTAEKPGWSRQLSMKTAANVSMWAVKARKRPRGVSDEIVEFQMNALLRSVIFDFMTSTVNFATVKVQDCRASYSKTNSESHITAKLVDFVVFDSSPGTRHPLIAESMDKKVFEAKITIYNDVTPELKIKDISLVDLKIQATMGRVKIVFLSKFINDFLIFIEPFSTAKEIVAEKANNALEEASKQISDAYASAVRALLDIKMDAPLIILPVNSKTESGVVGDLGTLSVSNSFVSDSGVFDELELKLKDLKLYRVGDTSTKERILSGGTPIISPITFEVEISRNMNGVKTVDDPAELSVTGTLHRIEAEMSKGDYNVIMSILTKNFSEKGSFESIKSSKNRSSGKSAPNREMNLPIKTVPRTRTSSRNSVSSRGSIRSINKLISNDGKHPEARAVDFNFKFHGFKAEIFSGETDPLLSSRNPTTSMAKLFIKLLSVEGTLKINYSLSATAYLEDCVLEDSRPSSQSPSTSRIVRLMESKNTNERMINIDYNRDDKGNQNLHVLIHSFIVVGSVAYLLDIAYFFIPEYNVKESVNATNSAKPQSSASQVAPVKDLYEDVPETKLTLFLKIEEPDVFLVENIQDINSDALMLNTEIQFKYWSNSEGAMSVMASLSNVRCHTCRFAPEDREASMAQILQPCILSLSISQNKGHGMRINSNISDLCLNVSPHSIEIIKNSVSAFLESMKSQGENFKNQIEHQPDSCLNLEHLWVSKPYAPDKYWFLKTEDGIYEATEDAILQLTAETPESTNLLKVDEQAIININNLVIKLEAGVGANTIPLILIESSFNIDVRNWSSSRMNANGSINLEMAYYNSELALWEPVIEPLLVNRPDGSSSLKRWDLNVIYKSNSCSDIGSALVSPNFDDVDGFISVEQLPPLSVISFLSRDILEITVTKTFLGVTQTLLESFGVEKGLERRNLPVAPMVVRNNIGKPLILNLENKGFKLYLHGTNPEAAGSSVELPSDSEVNLILYKDRSSKNVEYISPLRDQHEQFEAYLKIKVKGKKSTFEIPISKTDQRFFPFPFTGSEDGYFPHGIVSSIKVENGAKIITLGSIVTFVNHYSSPIDIFGVDLGNDPYFIKTIPPNSKFFVPFDDVYSGSSMFKFRISGPNEQLSEEFVSWKHYNEEPRWSTTIRCCNTRDTPEIYLSVQGLKKDIFLERTGNLSSVAFIFDIRPIILLKNCLPVTLHYTVGNGDASYVDPGKSAHFKGLKFGDVLLKLQIFEFQGTDWTSCQILNEYLSELSMWRFESENGTQKLDLGIHSTTFRGTKILSIYAPFWMINKTGKDLVYKGTDMNDVIHHPSEWSQIPLMFSYTSKSIFNKRKCSLKVGNSSYSDPFTLETIEDSGKVSCKSGDKIKKTIYHVGVNINLSKSSLTKIISFTPYYMILNRSTTFDIQIAEDAESGSEVWTTVKKEECVPFWNQNHVNEIVLRVKGTDRKTRPFTMTEVHSTMLMLGNCFGGLYVENRVSNSETLLTVSPYTKGYAPAELVNDTSRYIIEYAESGSQNIQFLQPGESALFTWNNPNGVRRLSWGIRGQDYRIENKLESDQEGLIDVSNNRHLGWVSFLDGMQRILLISEDTSLCYRLAHTTGEFERIDQEIDISIHGVGISLVNNVGSPHELLYVSITSSDIVWEYRKQGKTRYKPLSHSQCISIENDFQIFIRNKSIGSEESSKRSFPDFAGSNQIVLDYETEKIYSPVKGSLRRQFQKGLWCQIRTSIHQKQIHAKINRVQIDNQLRECLFPVIFGPVPPPKSVISDSIPKPFLELSILEYMSPEYHSTRQYKYFHALVQECFIKIDQGMLNAILELMETTEIIDEEIEEFLNEDLGLSSKELKDFATLTVTQGQQDFYDYLHLSPLKIHVSFSLTSYKTPGTDNRSNFLDLLFQSLGVTITDTDDIIFRLAYFERKHTFYTKQDLYSEMIRHYSSQAIKQIYVIIFGLDVIGNPFGLVVGVSRSVEDLFYEPFQGAVEGPSEFAEGLVIGIRSVFSGVIGGAAGTVSKITGALGKGLASLTFDEKFQNKRRDAIKKRGRQNFGESLARGSKGLVMGVFDGVTGVAVKPIEGAIEEGVGGFFKGVAKGVIGLVARPTGGIIDFASGTFDSVKRVTEVTEEITRIRPTRFFHPDGVVRYYDLQKSQGSKLLYELDKGYYSKTDSYVFHTQIICEKATACIVSSKRVLNCSYNQVLGNWSTNWEFEYHNLTGPPTVGEENKKWFIILKPKEDKKKVLGLFGSVDNSKKFFLLSREIARTLARKIEELRTSL